MKITICGSKRFNAEIMKLHDMLTEYGHKVYLPYMAEIKTYDGETNNDRVNELIKTIHEVHDSKIIESDVVLVVDTDKPFSTDSNKRHVGSDTKREIDFATNRGKNVLFMSSEFTLKMLKTL